MKTSSKRGLLWAFQKVTWRFHAETMPARKLIRYIYSLLMHLESGSGLRDGDDCRRLCPQRLHRGLAESLDGDFLAWFRLLCERGETGRYDHDGTRNLHGASQ